MSTNPVPPGYASVTPYLMVRGATAALDFYKSVFGATERLRMPLPDGRIAHAEIAINGSVIMLADECPEAISQGPLTLGGTPVTLHLYVSDCDAVFARALAAGARQIRPVADQFYGDRSGIIADPFGHIWNIATHIEDVSAAELHKRLAAMPK